MKSKFNFSVNKYSNLLVDDLIKHKETGYLYSLGKISDAILYINKILGNPNTKSRLGSEAKKLQIKNFSIEQMVNNTKKLYKKILTT